jgi:hypothetical protein
MQSPDHPELLFVEAAGYTTGRPDGKPLWIVVHDMEASETATRAENTAAYYVNPSDGRRVSSHYTADNNSVVQCVRLKDSAWTVGNRPGNNRGINWELSGFASQTRAQWLDPFGLAMFAQIAPILRADAAKYGIPLERRTVAELKAWKPGITSHNDLRLAFGGTTHTDPGVNFPWDVFLNLMTEDDMALEPADIEAVATRTVTKLMQYAENPLPGDLSYAWTVRKTHDAAVIAAATPGVEVDPAALVEAMAASPAFIAALGAAVAAHVEMPTGGTWAVTG